MSTVVPFNKTELNAIKSFSETLGKMNDFLGRVKDVLKSRTNSPIRQDITIQERIIGLICSLKTGYLWIGFYQYDNMMKFRFVSRSKLIRQILALRNFIDI